jgi:hypothetical protein
VAWESVWFVVHALESTGFEQDWDGQDPVRATFDYPGDLLTAYERVVAEPARGWMHGENDEGFPTSRWVPLIGDSAWFLVPGVTGAEVTCHRYSNPRQPGRRRSSPGRSRTG